MPIVRPFRALRYDPAAIGGDLSAVICPPYDVISPAERERLVARHRCNAVLVEVPEVRVGGSPDDGYRAAAETLASWRRDGTLRLDEEPQLYVYEQRYRLPGEVTDRIQRGLFARLRLERLGGRIRPHERTLSAAKEDRLRLLRATGTNTSPIVVLADDQAGRVRDALASAAFGAPAAEATDDSGVRHRLWVIPADAGSVKAALAAVGAQPLTIADGHHRYETAMRFREERREGAGRGLGQEAPFDYVLTLILPVGSETTAPTILPTHRLVTGNVGARDSRAARASPAAERDRFVARASEFFTVAPRAPEEIVRSFSPPFRPGGAGRFGLLLAGSGYELVARRDQVDPLIGPGIPASVRRLDVALLEAVLGSMLEPSARTDPDAVLAGLAYTHDAEEARRAIESGQASAAFLLDPTPVSDVLAVAAAGALMPQKSTYFYPKAATGLVMYPHQ